MRRYSGGAGLRDDGVGVRIDRVIVQEGGLHTLVSADTVIDLAVKAIKEDPNTESVIVQLVALTNAAPGEIVQADFNLIRNVVVFSQGEIIARRTFDGSRSPSEIFEEFILWIQGEAREAASNRGMMPQDDGTFGGVSPRQAYEVVGVYCAPRQRDRAGGLCRGGVLDERTVSARFCGTIA